MKITIIIPPYIMDKEGIAVRPNKAMLPVGPLGIATLLRDRGHTVQYVDLVFSGAGWRDELDGADADASDLLLLSCHTARNIVPCTAVLAHLRERGRYTPVVLGGNVCLTLDRAAFAKRGLIVDTVVRGYAHHPETIARILACESGDIFPPNESAPLPIPALDLVHDRVHAEYLEASGGRYPIVAFGTGCLWSCGYCTAKMGAPWSSRSIEDVWQETALAKTLGYRELWCVDNLCLVNPEATRAFDACVAEHGMTWSGMDRPELVVKNAAILSRLRALKSIAMGVESASRDQLQALKRGAKDNYAKTCVEAFHLLRDNKIESIAFVILDLPGSTECDFWMLWELLNRCHPDTVNWSFYNPPATAQIPAAAFGFYRWPLGYSTILPERIVQQAMLLAGMYWRRWTPVDADDGGRPFFENDREFRVLFEEGTISQVNTDRSPIGDIWEIWSEEERRRDHEDAVQGQATEPAARLNAPP